MKSTCEWCFGIQHPGRIHSCSEHRGHATPADWRWVGLVVAAVIVVVGVAGWVGAL